MARPVLMEFMFLFDPSDTWQHAYQVERWIADSLEKAGLEGEMVKTMLGNTPIIIDKPVLTGKKVYYIKSKDKLDLLRSQPNPVGRPKSIKGIVKSMSDKKTKAPERNFKKGKYLTRKGYLKK